MGNSLLCHYIDNCFKEGIILWGQKHCDWGGKVEDWGAFAPPVPMLKKALLLTNPECAKTYTDVNFRIIGQGRSSFHLSVLESVYIKTQNPVLCKQKDFIFSLGIFK